MSTTAFTAIILQWETYSIPLNSQVQGSVSGINPEVGKSGCCLREVLVRNLDEAVCIAFYHLVSYLSGRDLENVLKVTVNSGSEHTNLQWLMLKNYRKKLSWICDPHPYPDSNFAEDRARVRPHLV